MICMPRVVSDVVIVKVFLNHAINTILRIIPYDEYAKINGANEKVKSSKTMMFFLCPCKLANSRDMSQSDNHEMFWSHVACDKHFIS